MASSRDPLKPKRQIREERAIGEGNTVQVAIETENKSLKRQNIVLTDEIFLEIIKSVPRGVQLLGRAPHTQALTKEKIEKYRSDWEGRKEDLEAYAQPLKQSLIAKDKELKNFLNAQSLEEISFFTRLRLAIFGSKKEALEQEIGILKSKIDLADEAIKSLGQALTSFNNQISDLDNYQPTRSIHYSDKAALVKVDTPDKLEKAIEDKITEMTGRSQGQIPVTGKLASATQIQPTTKLVSQKKEKEGKQASVRYTQLADGHQFIHAINVLKVEEGRFVAEARFADNNPPNNGPVLSIWADKFVKEFIDARPSSERGVPIEISGGFSSEQVRALMLAAYVNHIKPINKTLHKVNIDTYVHLNQLNVSDKDMKEFEKSKRAANPEVQSEGFLFAGKKLEKLEAVEKQALKVQEIQMETIPDTEHELTVTPAPDVNEDSDLNNDDRGNTNSPHGL